MAVSVCGTGSTCLEHYLKIVLYYIIWPGFFFYLVLPQNLMAAHIIVSTFEKTEREVY